MKKISKHAENFKKENSAKETPKEQINKNEGATEKFRRGGVAKSKVPGNKHVDVVKGYRLVHGYKAVKGADKDTNYSKGVPKVKVDKGWRLPHGYETTEGAYNMKYENGGEVGEIEQYVKENYPDKDLNDKQFISLVHSVFSSQIERKGITDNDILKMMKKNYSKYATGSNIDSEWFGVDASLNISLEEYGFVATQRADKDYDDEYFVVYKISDDAYGTAHIRESELNAIIEGKEWADEDDIKSFLDFCGVSKEEWLDSRFEHKLSDLLGYWGYENIMGTDYYPWDKSHAYSVIGLDEEYRRGGIAKSKVPGNKHVDVAKGYRLTHGYKAVKGSDKNYNYAKGVAKLKVDKGWRLPHGYEVEEGAYNMKYKDGGEFDDKKYQDRYLLKNYGYKGKKGDKIIVSGYDDVLEVVYGSPLGITEKYEYLIKDTSTLPVLKQEGAYDMKYENGGGVDDYGTWRVKFWHSDTDKYKDVEVGGYDEDDAIENAKDRYDLDYLSGWSVVEANKLQYRTGGVAGSKHVDVTKGYRLVHGYKAVKGSDKQYNYSKGYPKVKVTPGYRLPHGYEIAEGAYNKKYDTGGNFDLTPEQYHRAVNHFIYFCFNYPNNFMDAFSSMKDHLQSKFHSIYDRVGAKAAMITFYTELDSENQKALLYWAMNNYKGTKLAEGGMLDVDVLSSFDIMKKGSNVNAKSSYVMLKGNRAYCGVHDKTYSEAVETAKSHACNSDMIIKGEMIWTNGRVKGIRLDDGTEMIYEQYEREFFTEPQLNQLKKISKRK